MAVMSIRFLGVRGSVASPRPDTAKVGGNTSCVEVTTPSGRFVAHSNSRHGPSRSSSLRLW